MSIKYISYAQTEDRLERAGYTVESNRTSFTFHHPQKNIKGTLKIEVGRGFRDDQIVALEKKVK